MMTQPFLATPALNTAAVGGSIYFCYCAQNAPDYRASTLVDVGAAGMTMRPAISDNMFLRQVEETHHDAFAMITECSELIAAPAGTLLQRAHEPVASTYFPTCGMVSQLSVQDDGSQVSVLSFGRDDAVHAIPDLDLDCARFSVVTNFDTALVRSPAAQWQQLLQSAPELHAIFTRYSGVLLARSQQLLACHTIHDVESRMARVLLEILDGQDGNTIVITHQGLADMMSVRRTTITLIANTFLNAGILACHRGSIEIHDRYALEQASCECHGPIAASRRQFALQAAFHKSAAYPHATASFTNSSNPAL
jgi:CRP-like cAMP-binding protein